MSRVLVHFITLGWELWFSLVDNRLLASLSICCKFRYRLAWYMTVKKFPACQTKPSLTTIHKTLHLVVRGYHILHPNSSGFFLSFLSISASIVILSRLIFPNRNGPWWKCLPVLLLFFREVGVISMVELCSVCYHRNHISTGYKECWCIQPFVEEWTELIRQDSVDPEIRSSWFLTIFLYLINWLLFQLDESRIQQTIFWWIAVNAK